MRTSDELLESGLQVLQKAFDAFNVWGIIPLFSGGHDSYCACYIASKHPRFMGQVFHIDTGIGSIKTRTFVEKVGETEGWKVRVYKSTNPKDTYARIVSDFGFPGPAFHSIVYRRLKERSLEKMCRVRGVKILPGYRWGLISGARQQESIRRMGHVKSIVIDPNNDRRVWVAPCFDWSGEEQRLFMNDMALLENPVKRSILGMSGECFCGCFARPGELEWIREICPDVAEKIDCLAEIAKKAGKPCIWGDRPPGVIEVGETGPLCNNCDNKAAAAGIKIVPLRVK